MGNLLQNQSKWFEEPIKVTSQHTPLLNISRQSRDEIFIMLNSGRVRTLTNQRTPMLPLMPQSPNNKLIRDLSKTFRAIDITHELYDANKDATIVIDSKKRVSGNIFERYLIKSRPFGLISYVHIIVLYSRIRANFNDQVNISVVANTPAQIIDKLIQHNLLEDTTRTIQQVQD